jgi:hypothetical protein
MTLSFLGLTGCSATPALQEPEFRSLPVLSSVVLATSTGGAQVVAFSRGHVAVGGNSVVSDAAYGGGTEITLHNIGASVTNDAEDDAPRQPSFFTTKSGFLPGTSVAVAVPSGEPGIDELCVFNRDKSAASLYTLKCDSQQRWNFTLRDEQPLRLRNPNDYVPMARVRWPTNVCQMLSAVAVHGSGGEGLYAALLCGRHLTATPLVRDVNGWTRLSNEPARAHNVPRVLLLNARFEEVASFGSVSSMLDTALPEARKASGVCYGMLTDLCHEDKNTFSSVCFVSRLGFGVEVAVADWHVGSVFIFSTTGELMRTIVVDTVAAAAAAASGAGKSLRSLKPQSLCGDVRAERWENRFDRMSDAPGSLVSTKSGQLLSLSLCGLTIKVFDYATGLLVTKLRTSAMPYDAYMRFRFSDGIRSIVTHGDTVCGVTECGMLCVWHAKA